MSDRDLVTKYEIRGADGNFIQVGETEQRKHIQIVITEINASNQRIKAATILLNKRQWHAISDTKYKLDVDEQVDYSDLEEN